MYRYVVCPLECVQEWSIILPQWSTKLRKLEAGGASPILYIKKVTTTTRTTTIVVVGIEMSLLQSTLIASTLESLGQLLVFHFFNFIVYKLTLKFK